MGQGGRGEGKGRKTGVERLPCLQEEHLDPDMARRRQFQLAALEATGEVGYRQLTVEGILDRTPLSRSRFYRMYADQEACYAGAYALASDRLATALLHAGEGEAWLAAFQAALVKLTGFMAAEPLVAKGVLTEVHVAGGAALTKRNEVFERLSRAVDAARRENKSRHSPPPVTASFILGAIEAAVMRALARQDPSDFAAALPDLTYLATVLYFGEERASAELGTP